MAKTLDEHVRLTRDAVDLVLRDLDRMGRSRPRVVVDTFMDSSVRITVDGGGTAPSVWATAEAEVIAETADYLQEQLDDECWPLCPEHDVGLHSEVRDGVAVWRCRLANHTVAVIGELGCSR